MKITIQLGDEVSKSAEQRIRQAVDATARHRCDFNGDEIAVERGDYTCIADGEGHPNAANLHAFVHRLSTDDTEFGRDADGWLLVPLADGGYERVVSR